MRRLRRQNEDHFREIQVFERLPRKDQMSVVNRIEGAAVDANFFQGVSIRQERAQPNDPFFVSRPCIDSKVRRMESASLGQLILTGVPGTELDPATAALFRTGAAGRVHIFGRNIESAGQLRKLIDDLRDLSAIEPIITIDQEGGRVSRLRLIGNEPPNANNCATRATSSSLGGTATITGRLLRLFGFNLDLCPVLDISFDDEADNSLRGRCYGATSKRSFDWRAHSTKRCGRKGSRAAENISPATPPRRSMRITTCR